MYTYRASKACFCKRRDGYKKTQGARWRSVSLFPVVARAPPARRVGNGGAPIPRNSGGWGMAKPQSPLPQDDGTPNPLHAPLQPILPVPPVEKPYEWHIKSTPQASLRYFKRAIVLAERRNSRTAEQQNNRTAT